MKLDRRLGDFTVGTEVFRVLPLAVLVGAAAAGTALALLDLIGLLTHLAYYGDVGFSLVQPSLKRLGVLSVLVPVAGGLIIGLMARFGSERIRGHGIPEAMESILIGGSRVEPRIAVLKPISSALSIGSGGPFGAEGPIILTGGAVGSVLGQFFHLSAIERRALLVAGACGGMAAVFGTPVAAALFGVELLVFEWRPRTMAPIAVSVIVADAIRSVFAKHHLLRGVPLFPTPGHLAVASTGVAEAALLGVAAGGLAVLLTTAVYGAEDLFKRLPIHWSWWPAIGGVVVGLGGLVDPRALGVGYASISAELAGKLAVGTLLTLLAVKLVIWSVALGSGTSGGILAPLLIMGAALGALIGREFSPHGPLWALVGMAATLAGVTRSPFTSVVFGFELTGDAQALLPMLAACTLAHLISTLLLRRSILTEKVARRGLHVTREYGVDPLEVTFVHEVLHTDLQTVASDATLGTAGELVRRESPGPPQKLFPVLDERNRLVGVLTRSDLLGLDPDRGDEPVATFMHDQVVTACADETLRAVATRMAEHRLGVLPVVDRADPTRVIGMLSTFELLDARRRHLEEERGRQRHLIPKLPIWLARTGVGTEAPAGESPDVAVGSLSPSALFETAAAEAGPEAG